MPSVPPPHLLLYAADPARQDLRAVLDDAGYDVAMRTLDAEADTVGHASSVPETNRHAGSVPHGGLLVVDALHHPEQALRLCNRLRSAQQELFVPILFVANGD